MKLNNNAARPQKTTRTGSTQPTSQKPKSQTKPSTNSRSVDSFQSVRTKAPVVLAPTETVAQERSRRVTELQGKLDQVRNAQPPMTEAQLDSLLGTADDGKYNINNTQLDPETRRGLFSMMRCIHQLGRARESIGNGDAYLAKAYLDTDRTDAYPGAIAFRDAASFNGMTGPEVLPFARAIIDVTQGAMTQQVLHNVVKYTRALEEAMAIPVTDGNRPEAIRIAKENLDANVRALGPEPLKSLEEGRRSTIDGLNTIGELVGSVPTPITRGAGALLRTAANGLEYASGDINGSQFALKEAFVAVDAVGGQLTQKMRMLPKLVADAGLEFTKSLAGELAKIPADASESDRKVATDKAVRAALYNTVMGVLTDIGVASMGEAGEKIATEVSRALTSTAMGALGAAGGELYKIANDPSLTPEKKAAAMKEVAWKGMTNLVKTLSEGALESVKK